MIEKRIPLRRPTEDMALNRVAKQEAVDLVDEILELSTSECQIILELLMVGLNQDEIGKNMGMPQQAVSKRWQAIKQTGITGEPVEIKPFVNRRKKQQ